MSRLYFSYLMMVEASFLCWDNKSDAFYAPSTIGSNKEVPGTPYIIENCEIDIDA